MPILQDEPPLSSTTTRSASMANASVAAHCFHSHPPMILLILVARPALAQLMRTLRWVTDWNISNPAEGLLGTALICRGASCAWTVGLVLPLSAEGYVIVRSATANIYTGISPIFTVKR